MIELPKGWESKQLKELFSFVLGGDWGKDPEYPDADFKTVYCIRGTEFRNWQKEKGLTSVERKVKSSSVEKRKLQVGDILIEISGGGPDQPVGRTILIDEQALKVHENTPLVCTNFIRLARPQDSVSSRYLNYYLQSFYLSGEVTKYQGGSNNLRNLKFKEYEKIEVPIAPIEEQKRIADKLDSVLAKVEAAQARLDKIPTILKRFRQSVLAAATSGELTKDWRGDEKYRDETLNWPISKIPESWDLKFLEEVAESRLGKMLDKSKNSGIATKYLGNINLRWHHIDLFELKEILVSQKEIDELNIRDGDLLLCEGGEPGRGAVWKGGDNNLVFQKAIHRVRCTDCISPEFLLYSIENDFFSNRLSLLYTGTTIKHLTGKALKKYPVRIPPIAEQIEIVRMVNRLLEASSKIEEQYLAAKLRVNQLTQSILKKAFEGELLTSEVENEFLQELSDVEAVEC